MAKYSSKDCVFLIDGYNVLGVTTQIDHSVEAVTEEVTALGDTWETHEYLGLRKAAFSQQGFFDDASGSSNEALNNKQGNERILCLGFENNTIGKNFNGFQGAMQTNFERMASGGALHRANAKYLGDGITEDGKILHALTARTANGNTESTPVDNAAQTTDGGSLYLQVSALVLGGYTDVIIKVRQSDNGSAWEDLETFTAVTVAPAKERKIKAGIVKRYLAVSWAFTGTGNGPSITFFVGLVRN